MRKLVLLLLAFTAIVTPAAAATFTIFIGGCGTVSDSGSSPVSGSVACSPVGGASLGDGSAAATFGHVGGSTSAAIGSGYHGSAFGINTASVFSDVVTFTAVDKSITQVLVAPNLAFSGAMNATGAASAGVNLLYQLGYATLLFDANTSSGVTRNHFSVVSGSVSGTLNNALLSTGAFLLPVNTPVDMTLRLDTGAGVHNGSGSPASATSHFSNSFEIPFGMDAFVLPDGVTANAGAWLVNNRRVAEATGIPEPTTWGLMALGCVAVMLLRRRRLAGV